MKPNCSPTVLIMIGLFAFTAFKSVYGAETAKAMPPNILLILTDDQGYADVGVNGHPVLKTPNMDRLANAGLRFTQFQACAECSPSRAGIMTGRNPLKIGVTHTGLGKYYLSEEQKTMADHLREVGYQTAIVGKWHLGTHLPSRPQDKGFDYSFIHEGGALTALQNSPWEQGWLNPGFVRNGTPVKTQGFGTDVEINDSLRWLKTERDANRPFFLYLACSAPHDPYTPPAADMQRFLDMGWDPRLAGFYGLIENLDRHLGRLMEYLESSGLAENTLVVFMGDNGTAASHHTEWTRNGLSPWNAGLYGGQSWGGAEGALRVPCFIRWPGKIPPGTVSDELAAYYDLLPTFLDIAGAKKLIPDSTDGISLKRYLMDVEHQSLPDRVVYNIGHLALPHARDFGGVDFLGKVTARTKQYRQAGRSGLFDVQIDPGQTNNLAKKYPEILKMLHEGVTGFWKESQAAALAPVYIHLGSPKQPVVMLTSADWRPLPSGNQTHFIGSFGHFNAQRISRQLIDWQNAGMWPKGLESVKDRLNGFWNVYFTRPGTYEFRATLTPPDVRNMVQLKEGRVWLVVDGKTVCEAPVNHASHEAVLHWDVDRPFRGEIQVRWSGQLPFDAELGAFVCDVERRTN